MDFLAQASNELHGGNTVAIPEICEGGRRVTIACLHLDHPRRLLLPGEQEVDLLALLGPQVPQASCDSIGVLSGGGGGKQSDGDVVFEAGTGITRTPPIPPQPG